MSSEAPTTVELAIQLAKQQPRETVFRLCSIVTIIMGRVRGPFPGLRHSDQLSLIDQLSPPLLADRLRQALTANETLLVIHAEQLLLAACLAGRYGDPRYPPQDSKPPTLMEFLLRINDLLSLVDDSQDIDDLRRLTIRRLSLLPREQERYTLGRYFDLLVTRARGRSRSESSSLDETFAARTGMAIEEYLALGLAFVSPFLDVQGVADLRRIGYDKVVAQIEARLPDALRSAAHKMLWASEDTYGARLDTSSPRALALTNFVDLIERPIVPLSNGGAVPISVPLFMQRMGEGVYWELFSEWRRRDPGHGIENLNARVGELFQDYCTEAFRQAYASHPKALFIPEASFRGAGGSIATPDAVVLERDRLVAIEMTVSGLTVATRTSGDPSAFRNELRDPQLTRKLQQPGIGAENILQGRLRHPDLKPEGIREVHTLVISLRPFPLHFLLADVLREEVSITQEVRTSDGRVIPVSRPELLSAEEMEMIEPAIARGMMLSDELVAKSAALPDVRDGSFKNYMFSTGIATEHPNERMKALFDALLEAVRPTLRRMFGEA